MKITEHIHALKIRFQLNIRPGISIPRFVYVYLVYGQKEVWLIDTGVGGSEDEILDYVKATARHPADISVIMQTHSHPDHIGATKAIQRTTGCAVVAHERERMWIEDTELQCQQRPVPGFHSLVGGSVKVDRSVEDGDVLQLDNGLRLHVLHTPGHSQGSLSLWCPSEKVLICGDAVPVTGSIPIYEDPDQSARSIKRLIEIEEVEVLLSSWDEPRYASEAKTVLVRSLDYLHQIHEAVLRSVESGSTPDSLDLCLRVLGELGLPEAAVSPLVAQTFLAHVRSKATIRPCDEKDFDAIYAIINDAARAYKGVIPEDRWHEPYMSREELHQEIADGVRFRGYEVNGKLVGVMGIQDVQDVTLIRHAYVFTTHRSKGIGSKLLTDLRRLAGRQILIGTWAAADWAIRFYERHGFRRVTTEEKNRLLKKYWNIPQRQVETSVVLTEKAVS